MNNKKLKISKLGLVARFCEKKAERNLQKIVENKGGKWLKFISPGNNGVLDRIALLPGGKIWFVEMKSENLGLDPLQKYWWKELTKLGFECILINNQHSYDEFVGTISISN